METLLLIGVGLAATAYLANIIWKAAHGQGACNCESAGTCSGKCACSTKNKE